MNFNERAEEEYRLVTDGKHLYRMHPRHRIPEDVMEAFSHHGESVYTKDGQLFQKFCSLQEIQPTPRLKHIAVAVRQAIQKRA